MPSSAELGKMLLQTVLLRDAFLWRLSGQACALTFDDGPHPEHTPRLLDLLAKAEVRATFFVVGASAQRHPALIGRMLQEGHALGSHTWSHRELPALSRAQLRMELDRCRRVLVEVTGRDTVLVRPPRGRLSPRVLLLLARWGYRVVHWSKTYSDYLQDGREALLGRISRRGLDCGDIALFHDNNAHTIEALAAALPQWQAHGRSFTVLSGGAVLQ